MGNAVICYRADNKGLMPCAIEKHQIPYDPRGESSYYCVDKNQGIPIGVLDYGYLNNFKILSGPDADGYCTISAEEKNNGNIWICPVVKKYLKDEKRSGPDERGRAGILLAQHNREIGGNTHYDYDFFSPDFKEVEKNGKTKKIAIPTHIPTNAPVSLDLCPMMAETCANSAMNGATFDSQKGYRAKMEDGSYNFPPPHDGFFASNWMDGHAEAIPAEKDRFLNWQPIHDNDKYYAPYGERQQYK